LNPVRVSSNRNPSASAIERSILLETALASIATDAGSPSGCFARHRSNVHAASMAPISFPRNARHRRVIGSYSHAARRSASGSLATHTAHPRASAVLRASAHVSAPSSGFGNATVEKSGSGSICDGVSTKGGRPKPSNANRASAAPTPWRGV
jgi:hypothetical protein